MNYDNDEIIVNGPTGAFDYEPQRPRPLYYGANVQHTEPPLYPPTINEMFGLDEDEADDIEADDDEPVANSGREAPLYMPDMIAELLKSR